MELSRSTIPGPDPMRLVGVPGNLIRWISDPIGYASRVFAKYGPLAWVVRGPMRVATPHCNGVLLATGAELNRALVTQHDTYHMFALPGALYPTGDASPREQLLKRTMTGLFHVNGDEHRRHKRLLLPAFHRTHIETYRDDMVAATDEVLASWQLGETRDVWRDMTALTLKIATRTLFGADAGERGIALSAAMQEWLVTMMGIGVFVRRDWPGLPYRRWLDLTAFMDRELVEILREKRARGAGTPDMLSMLLHARDEDGSALTEDELIGHAGVIFAAGHETSTNALAWTLFLLAQHPEIAEQLVEELRGELHGGAPTVEQLGKLPLLDGVVKESMRVLPPVPFHPRFSPQETELGGFKVPALTEILISIFHMHHDPDVFRSPERFEPSRWETIRPTTFEYNPFSAGPRMCIGAAFAQMEIKIVLAMLLQRFRIALLPQSRVDRRVAITMAPKGGLPAIVRPADNAWRRERTTVRGDVRELVFLAS